MQFVKSVMKTFFFAGALALNLIAFEGEVQGNLIGNPGFENAPGLNLWEINNWAKNEVSCSLDTENPHAGKYSQKVTMITIKKSPSLQLVQQFIAKPGMLLEISFWMRGLPNAAPIEIAIRKKSAPYTSFFKGNAEPSDDWREFKFTVALSQKIAPEDTVLLFDLKDENTFWLDDVSVAQAPEKDNGLPLNGNQVLNGSFEVGIDKWCAGSWIGNFSNTEIEELDSRAVLQSVSIADAPHGTRVLHVPVLNGVLVSLDSGYFPLRYGYPATVTFWAKTPSPGSKINARVLHGMSKNIFVAGTKTFVISKEGWNRYQFEFVPPLSTTKTYHFRIEFSDPGEYYIDGVFVGEGSATCDANLVNVGYEPTQPYPANVLYRDEPVSFRIFVETIPAVQRCKLYGRVIDTWNIPIHQFTLEIPIIQSRGATQISLPSDKFGGFKCELYTETNTKMIPACEILYSVLPKIKSPKDSTDAFFGVHANLSTYNLKLAELMGGRSLRLHPPLVTKWKFIEKWG